MKPPICKDCVHMRVDWTTPICAAIYNLVTGEPVNIECLDARGHDGWCGLEGKLFEPSQPKIEATT